MSRYTIREGPNHVVLEGPSLLSGYYEAEFTDLNGERHTRYLTDKGRAEVLRRIDEGQREFSDEELQEWTVAPDIQALEARAGKEAGEGG